MLFLPRGDTLSKPSGVSPGIDFSHPAAGGNALAFSAVYDGINLLNPVRGTFNTGSNTYPVDSLIGKSIKNTAGAAGVTYSGQSTTNNNLITFAAIVRAHNSGGSTGFIGNCSSGTGGVCFGIDSSPKLILGGNGSFKESSFTYTSDVPYFIAASLSTTAAVFVARRLDTGQILSSSTSGFTTIAPNGTYSFAGNGSNGFAGHIGAASIAAGMMSFQFTPLHQLLAWADDPWAFWYPDANLFIPDMYVGVLPVTTRGGTFSMMGI